MKSAFLNWYNKISNKFMYFHQSKKNRQIFSLMYFTWLLVIILFFTLSGFLFYLFGIKWNDNKGLYVNSAYSIDEILELIFGLLIFLFTSIIAITSNVMITGWFKESKENYTKTGNFAMQKTDIDKLNLALQSNKDLKWFYKLGYITKEKLADQKEYNLNIKKALKEKVKKG